jgi:hypothetical protein
MKIPSAFSMAVTIVLCGVLTLGRPNISGVEAQSTDTHARKIKNDAMQDAIVAKEREGLDALKTGDLQKFGRITSDNAIFVDAQGSATKAQVLANVAGFTLSDYSMENMQFVRLSKKAGLISYKIHEKGVSHGKEFTAQAYVSSIWSRDSGQWLCLFSQETGAR